MITLPKLHLYLATALTSRRILFGSVKVPFIHQTLWTGNKAIAPLESKNLIDLSPVQDVASASGPCVFIEPPASFTGALRSAPWYPKSPWGLLILHKAVRSFPAQQSTAKWGEGVQGTNSNSRPMSLQVKQSIGLYKNEKNPNLWNHPKLWWLSSLLWE